MKVYPVPVLQDNYAYLLVDEASRTCAVVDPGKVVFTIPFRKELAHGLMYVSLRIPLTIFWQLLRSSMWMWSVCLSLITTGMFAR